MNKKISPTLNWNEAPDTIDPKTYAKIRGISEEKARDIFKEKNFPLIDKGKFIADKTAVRLYDMGINPKVQSKESISFLILTELKSLRSQLNTQISKEMITND